MEQKHLMCELTISMLRFDEEIMKKQKVSTGIRIDSITPYITAVTLPSGNRHIIYAPMTLEDLENMEREDRWYRAQLEANRIR
jgi:hypothetical protein